MSDGAVPLHLSYTGAGEGLLTELELLRGDAVVRVIPIEEAAVTFGRDLGNRVVLSDPDVSAHHAVVQRGAEGPVVRDLGSTNGTFVNGERVEGARALLHGDELALGREVRLRVRHVGSGGSGELVLRDLTAGTVHLVEGDRVHVGSGERCHVRLAQGPERAATLVVHPDGEGWLTSAEGDRSVALGEEFEVAGSAFRLELAAHGLVVPTVRPMSETRYPYVLTVTLAGAAGGMAEVEDPASGRRCAVSSEPRVALLYLLARQLQADRAAGALRALAGWCHDEDLMLGIWGREGLTGAPSRYSVLLHRVRKDLEQAGLDPLCIEKRRGATRLHVDTVNVA